MHTSQTGAIVRIVQAAAASGGAVGSVRAPCCIAAARAPYTVVHASRRSALNALPSPRSSVRSSAAPTVARCASRTP